MSAGCNIDIDRFSRINSCIGFSINSYFYKASTTSKPSLISCNCYHRVTSPLQQYTFRWYLFCNGRIHRRG
nr:MAG TPA_asm: hypothetical protein [Caudoviricetes sp.]DAZ18049.1 MAG TPA: hypothetical protein [Caudoviricetes sp.]